MIQQLIERKIAPAYETPALCLMISKYQSQLKIKEMDERIVSCCNNYYSDLTSIIHMKSIKNNKDNIRYNKEDDDLPTRQLKLRIKMIKNVKLESIFNLVDEFPLQKKHNLNFPLENDYQEC